MAEYYVATTGSSGNPGTFASPWSLAHAVGGAGGIIQPGDTIWQRGGLYQQATPFVQSTSGAAGNLIKWRNYPGEFVEIQSTNTGDIDSLQVNGSYNHWLATVGQNEGIVLSRGWAENPRSSARGKPIWVKDVPQTGNKFSHIVCRDGDSGIYMGNAAGNDFRYGDIEFYGVITYNCGHGPALHHNYYLRHASPAGELAVHEGCMGFNSCNKGLQIYSQDGSAGLHGWRVSKYIQFNSGVIGDGTSLTDAIVVTDGNATAYIDDFSLLDFVGYHPSGVTGNRQALSFGNNDVTNRQAEVARGYLVGGNLGVRLGLFRTDGSASLNFHDNYENPRATVQTLENLEVGSMVNYSGWANNAWRRDPTATAWRHNSINKTFATWKTDTGLGGTDTTPAADPTVNKVFVFPLTKYNPYAHVCFFNWESSSSVNVDLSSLLNAGDGFEVYNVQDIFGAPVLSGTYAGVPVAFPTTGKTPPVPVGVLPRTAPTTAPFFDAFLVRRTSAAVIAPVVRGGGPAPSRVYVVDVPLEWLPKNWQKGRKG